MKILLLIALASMVCGPIAAQTETFKKIENGRLLVPTPLEGEIEVVDGDTLFLGIHEIRLFGIDAPEHGQTCIKQGQKPNYCYKAASNALKNFASAKDFRCEIIEKENKAWKRYGRYIANCYVGDTDVSAALVAQGLAYADDMYGDSYRPAQSAAAVARLGIHGTEHVSPKQWRREKNEVSAKPCK